MEGMDGVHGDASKPCYDKDGNIVAMKGLVVPSPWLVLLSKKFAGKFANSSEKNIEKYLIYKKNTHFIETYLFFFIYLNRSLFLFQFKDK